LAVLALFGVLLVVGFALSRTLEAQLVRSVDRSLTADLEDVVAGGVVVPRGFPSRIEERRRRGLPSFERDEDESGPLQLSDSVSNSRIAAALYDAEGEVVTQSAALEGVELDLSDIGIDTFESTGDSDGVPRSFSSTVDATYVGSDAEPGGQGSSGTLRVRTLGFPAGQTIVVAQSLVTVDEALAGVRTDMLVGGLPLLALLGLLVWFLTGRALGPVETIRREVDEIDALGLERRVTVPEGSYELERLATTMNHMLDRVDASVAGQRRFVADASHELRSPLAGIRSTIEVDLAHPDQADWPRTGAIIHNDAIRMQALLEDLLTLARSDASAVSPVDDATRHPAVDLDDLVLAEANRLKALHPHLHFDLRAVSAAQLSANPDEMSRLARNLIENAARHATTLVALTVSESAGKAVLEVADDGPGVPPEKADEIFERFVRLDEARARSDGGSGLGLAIVSEIVARNCGSVRVVQNLPGARFIVELPLS